MYTGSLIEQLVAAVERAEKRSYQPVAVQELEAMFALTGCESRQNQISQDLLGVA